MNAVERTFRVLVFPGGSEIGLEINQALRHCKEVELFSAGTSASSHAPFVFAKHYALPGIGTPGWLDALNRLVVEHAIGYIIPAYDDVLVALAANAERIAAKIVTSPLETCSVARSKSATYARLRGVVPVPRVYAGPDDIDGYPVFLKPDRGQGSQRTHVVSDPRDVRWHLRTDPELIITDYLPGDEYTVDCFSDREQGVLFCGGRQRMRVRNGISVHSALVEDSAFGEYARAIASTLTFHGAWFFQVKRNREGELTLLEVAPRIAGSMALHRVQGVNFPLLSLYERAGVTIRVAPLRIGAEIDRALTNRYRHDVRYGTAYVDFDDTLVVAGKVNVDLVRLLYQCLNRGKRLVLITRHRSDIQRSLSRYRLSGIFDEVIACGERECKADYIHERDAIFIDDSFGERQEVQERLAIPTFDSSMIELLVDDRA